MPKGIYKHSKMSLITKNKMAISRKRYITNLSILDRKKWLEQLSNARKNVVYKSGPSIYNWKGGYEHKLMKNRERLMLKKNVVGTHSLEDWNNLKRTYNFTCPACDRKEPDIILTEDHIMPISKGGTNYIENIQPLCKSCNTKKLDKIINKYVPKRF